MDARIAATTLSPRSPNEPVRAVDGSLGEAIDGLAREEAGYAGAEERDALQDALVELSPRARRVLRLRGELELTTPEIARRMGLSNSQAARLISAALRDLRAALTGSGESPTPSGRSDAADRTPRQPMKQPAVRLVEADPELFAALPAQDRAPARQIAVAPALRLQTGATLLEPALGPNGFGLLVIDGAVLRNVMVDRRARAKLLGPGDSIGPVAEELDQFLPVRQRWQAVQPTHIAVLDTALLETLCRWPTVVARLLMRGARAPRPSRAGWR